MNKGEIKIGQEVRYFEDGMVYKVTDVRQIEVSAGVHSFDMEVADLESDTKKLREILTQELLPAVIPTEELHEYLNIMNLGLNLRDFMRNYNFHTGDEITGISWDSLTPNRIHISGKRLGTKELKIYIK